MEKRNFCSDGGSTHHQLSKMKGKKSQIITEMHKSINHLLAISWWSLLGCCHAQADRTFQSAAASERRWEAAQLRREVFLWCLIESAVTSNNKRSNERTTFDDRERERKVSSSTRPIHESWQPTRISGRRSVGAWELPARRPRAANLTADGDFTPQDRAQRPELDERASDRQIKAKIKKLLLLIDICLLCIWKPSKREETREVWDGHVEHVERLWRPVADLVKKRRQRNFTISINI